MESPNIQAQESRIVEDHTLQNFTTFPSCSPDVARLIDELENNTPEIDSKDFSLELPDCFIVEVIPARRDLTIQETQLVEELKRIQSLIMNRVTLTISDIMNLSAHVSNYTTTTINH